MLSPAFFIIKITCDSQKAVQKMKYIDCMHCPHLKKELDQQQAFHMTNHKKQFYCYYQ